MKKYKYTSTDNSLLRPHFYKYVSNPLAKSLPSWIHPNHLTLTSLVVMNLLWITIALLGLQPLTFIITGILLLVYQLFDSLDGALARATQRSSALGEFMDHCQDILGNGISLFVNLYLFQINPSWLVIVALWYAFLYQGKIFSYQKQTTYMIFSIIGPLEASLIGASFLFSSAYPPVYQFFISTSPFELNYISSILLLLLLSHGLQTIFFLLKDKIHPRNFLIYAAIGLTFLYSLSTWGVIHQTLFIIPFNIHFIGSVIRSHLFEESYPFPDIIAPIFVLLAPFITENPLYLMGLPISYLWARALFTYFKSIGRIIKRNSC